MIINKNTSELDNQWTDWRWQQRNACRDELSLSHALGGLGKSEISVIKKNLTKQKLQITPYYLELIKSHQTAKNLSDNPLWRQVAPLWAEEPVGGYDGESENWELNHEMKTPICQHKYQNRVILRITNTCNSYCQFCFEALRTLKPKTEKENAKRNSFEESLDYIRHNPEIEEVILSGGDPLMLTDSKLEESLSAIRAVNENLLIRLHSRALTFNPFRITNELIETFQRYRLSSFGIHVCHPWELSEEFSSALRRLQSVVPLVFANTPFLKGINDKEETLHRLFIELYRLGIKPYYLYHFMPFSPGAGVYKASINDALSIMNRLKRRISNIALPEYVLPHSEGKFTVPLINEENPVPTFEYRDGKRYYRFTNWKGDACEWLDN
ncbi:KamA family radical SAM protein [Pseudomonas japonica]|uniref:L-lysine 2,3-aminomutase n=1 Tax=Pseudomonas japonica TaxID=256466 RepID=A0A239I2N0_9PSED|nr:radical SAM protein [Pseudomonas japonica]SNS87855.1 L-lysine 2,3-aminomutase [Pseudomonas japonica]